MSDLLFRAISLAQMLQGAGRTRVRYGHAVPPLGMLVAPVRVMQNQAIARVDLPGFARADITLRVHQTRLLIAAGPEGAADLLRHIEGDTHLVYRRNRGTGGFFCSVLLPNGIHPDRVEATLTDGVLVVTAPVGDGSARA